MTSVIIRGYPFEDQDTTETQYGRIMAALSPHGVDGPVGGSSFDASLPGGMFIRVQPGRGWARGFVGDHDTPTGVDVPVEASESQARVDRLVLRIDPVSNTATLETRKGTRGSLTPPALTRSETGAYDVKLFRYTVGALAPEPTNLVDEREWLGSPVGRWSTENRPTTPEVRPWTLGVNFTRRHPEFWDPTEQRWVPLLTDAGLDPFGVNLERGARADLQSEQITTLSFDQVRATPGAAVQNNLVVTVPRTGRYVASFGVTFEKFGVGTRLAWLLYNGTTRVVADSGVGVASVDTALSASRTLDLAAGDTLQLQAWHNAGQTLTILGQTGEPPGRVPAPFYFTLDYVSRAY